jgi:hypothetical protein
MVQLERYQTACHELLAKASEKGWGAAVPAVKAVAERRGWEHNGHRERFEVVRRVVEETGDSHIHRLLLAAKALHMNGYENRRTADSVQEGLPQVQEPLDCLDPLLA